MMLSDVAALLPLLRELGRVNGGARLEPYMDNAIRALGQKIGPLADHELLCEFAKEALPCAFEFHHKLLSETEQVAQNWRELVAHDAFAFAEAMLAEAKRRAPTRP